MFKYNPRPKPHWQITHAIFAKPEPATYQDVLDAYGIEMIRERIEKAVKGTVYHYDDRCVIIGDYPMPLPRARAHVWRHLRGVIEEQREIHRKRRQRESEYRGDPNSPSPLNPFRRSKEVDVEDSFGLTGADRDYNPLIL